MRATRWPSTGPTVGIPGVVNPNDFPYAFVQNAAFSDLIAWVDSGLAPPHAPGITVDFTKTPPQIVRDQFGNAKGGVRTPFLDVPIATYVPTDTAAHMTRARRLQPPVKRRAA